jgi:CTP synthase
MKSKKTTVKKKPHKFVFVVGGVMSGVGKGITTSSIGMILKAKGFAVNMMKVDPYLNVDAGTMNPTEHGEVFVLNSGLETDQDMGNYERFLNRDLASVDYATSGMVYKAVIDRERNLGYGGKCVEAIPHVRDEIVKRFEESARVNKSDVTIVEIGGTVGDYQNVMFYEAARHLKVHRPADVLFVMVSYLPIPSKLGEMKSKPTQNAVHQLNSYGIHADVIVARAEVPLDDKRKEKIAISCSIPTDHVISAPDIDSVYDVPLNFERDKIGDLLCRLLLMPKRPTNLAPWKKFVDATKAAKAGKKEVRVAVVGKYFDTGDFTLADSYLSVIDAIKFSCYQHNVKPNITWVNSKKYDKDPKAANELADFDAIVVPGGFGESGIEGKLAVIRVAREKKIPYLGLCYGMQLQVIEFARNVAGVKGATTAEIDPKAKHKVVDIMLEQKARLVARDFGGSMRLGSYPCVLREGSVALAAYKKFSPERVRAEKVGKGNNAQTVYVIDERHRHRYEVNPEYVQQIADAGLVFSGTSPDGTLMEIAELPKSEHPFFVATQFHPEFLARPLAPHALFSGLINCALK